MNFTYPHTIDSGHGEVLTFLRRVNGPSGDLLEVENRVQPGAGPPMHVHYLQDEVITVVQGRIAAEVAGQEPTYHGSGETVTFKRGVAHRFWNSGNDVLIGKGYITPPDNIEYFLGAIFASIKNSRSGRPSLFDSAFLLTKYKSEFDMVEIPALVKTVVFPIVLMIGRIMGKGKKFRDAPKAAK